MLKIFSDHRYLPPGQNHVVMLYPFWGANAENPADPSAGRFERYTQVGREYFTATPLTEADIAVLPYEWLSRTANHHARKLAIEAGALGKKVIIFFNNDSDETIDIENSFIFRTSFYRSTRQPNEFALPAWSGDFLKASSDGAVPLRPKQAKPVVGYCGYATLPANAKQSRLKSVAAAIPGMKRLFSLAGIALPPGPWRRLRSVAVEHLSHSDEIETNFVIRDAFWNGAYQYGQFNLDLARQSRREFVQNIIDSDYVLCARGAGNFSYRLYETLSCGRIPVFIDTDCVLPYDFTINWKDYCVWVDAGEIDQIDKKVAEFHQSLSQPDFTALQRRCRSLWENYLSPEGFFMNFHRHFRKN